MERPDFKKLKEMTESLTGLVQHFDRIYTDQEAQQASVRAACYEIRKDAATKALRQISVEELKKSKAGIRVSVLQEAGYEDLLKLAEAQDWELKNIDGIGDKQLEAIRNIIREFTNHLADRQTIQLSVEEGDDPALVKNRKLIRELAVYRQGEMIRRDASDLSENLHSIESYVINSEIIRSTFQWIFSSKAQKISTNRVISEIVEFLGSPFFQRITHFISLYQDSLRIDIPAAIEDYKQHAAEYYVLLESVSGITPNTSFVYDTIPAQLAGAVDAFPLHTTAFHGNLRVYQTFGTKYILMQQRVLLGDEMGLGKTIQAIAAMAHLYTEEPSAHFLVVCPASVLVNWCREIQRFSAIRPFLLHGSDLEAVLGTWQSEGGAAVTNYETMGKIVDRIDNHMRLKMLVIDEAHYIKNPEAQRTKHIHQLENESERILLMTGTPLENHVDEMCTLIDFLKPELSGQIRGMAQLSHAPQFREMLSPVYLRRTRDQVLQELPPIVEEQEWCHMTQADLDAYIAAVQDRSFPAMRRVSFLQEDLSSSSKAQRLKELCEEAIREGRKVLIFSYFLETIAKVSALLGPACFGVITGKISVTDRQILIDRFAEAPEGSILLSQVLAGGTGLNIQSASVVIFCEPQIKPSLEKQAISRVYRMGQVRNVLVYRLLCESSVDEAMVLRLKEKQEAFDAFADESAVAQATENLIDREWIQAYIEKENQKYLPMVI